ncbi:hypothetical protein PRZ48_009184 [Zasmidium cellare]|uniref:Uncharacterized protein n=1 Tax=Zasmidium cellare TaxID=395010 RepID=A0ABR0EBD6_ZASCE|nr:hypothetical protein PRZ48_009184 [Zasmidium cellare]
MASLQYGNDEGAGTELGKAYHYSQYVHLPHGITKLSGQGGWTRDGQIDAQDWKGQIERAFDNIEVVLKTAGLSGLDDVGRPEESDQVCADELQIYLIRSYLTDMESHFGYLTEVMKKRLAHRPVYTALSVPKLGAPGMVVEIEVEAYRK